MIGKKRGYGMSEDHEFKEMVEKEIKKLMGLLPEKERNNILFPTRNHTEKIVEDQMSEMFEDDRPKSME